MKQKPKEPLTISQLVTVVQESFSQKGYSERYLNELRYVLKLFHDYAVRNGSEIFYPDMISSFLSEYYNSRLSNHRAPAERAVNAIQNYYEHGSILRRKTQSETPWNSCFGDLFTTYYYHYKSLGWSDSSLYQTRRSLHAFSVYLEQINIKSLEDVTEKDITDFINCRYNTCTQKHRYRTLMDIRRFFEYLQENGIQTHIFEHFFPTIRVFDESEEIRYVFTKEEVNRILAVVDRNSPLGKRDYAILLIASRYGMRACDIKNIQFSDIDWMEEKLSITQSKTGEPLELPLFPDIGWAIIDYINNGRPISSCQYIFIIHSAPYNRFIASLNHIVTKYINLAGISVKKGMTPGIHSFRRAVASELLKCGVQISAIKEILGHNSINTTIKYQKIDISQLSVCALEVPIWK